LADSKIHNVLIVNDHALMRSGLEAMLKSEPGYEAVGGAADGMSAMRAVTKLKPDIIMMDLTMPRTNCIDAIARIKRQHPNIKIVALTFHKEDEYIRATLEAGADAYVLKDDSRSELFSALASVVSGKKYLSPSIVDTVVAGYISGGDVTTSEPSWKTLTQREREVIKLIAEGKSSREIASHLAVRPRTVEKHRTNLMRKLDLHNVSEVTVYAIRNGFVTD
jgi:DNA-binding NarL/FixJ family response regulator